MDAGKRHKGRKHLIYLSEIHDRDNPSFTGHLVDISKSGLMMLSDDKIEINRKFRIEIILPEETDGRDRIYCTAKSMWCKKDVNPDYYATGLEIQAVDTIDEQLIEYMIYEYGLNN